MMLDSPHTSAAMSMRGNTPPTTSFPPHRSRPAGNPPNLQPATVSEEERVWRGPTSRRTLVRASPDWRPPPTAQHALPPRTSTSHPPHQQDAVHSELRPGTGKGAIAVAGPPRRATRPTAGRRRPGPAVSSVSWRGPGPASAVARPATAAPHDSPPTNNNRM